jgi:hypothetical protein
VRWPSRTPAFARTSLQVSRTVLPEHRGRFSKRQRTELSYPVYYERPSQVRGVLELDGIDDLRVRGKLFHNRVIFFTWRPKSTDPVFIKLKPSG